MTIRIVVLARYPTPGGCKTRLIPALGAEGAAAVHKQLAELTVSVLRASGLSWELWGTGGTEAEFCDWLGEATFREQPEGDLTSRLRAASDPCPVLFLGTDCPALSPALLDDAVRVLSEGRFVIGPAHDGGYWTLGMPYPEASLLEGIPWGRDTVYETTRERMAAAGITPVVLPTLHDIDRPEDLDRWQGVST